jgi:hypothetical protein
MKQSRWTLVAAAAAAAGGAGALVRRGRSARTATRKAPEAPEAQPLPSLTTQSSPGQIADLQQAYGAEMAAPSAPPPVAGTPGG